MKLVRTSLRVREDLKKDAEYYAFKRELTLQDVFNTALEQFIHGKKPIKKTKIKFLTHSLGVPLDNLTRSDFYGDPRF